MKKPVKKMTRKQREMERHRKTLTYLKPWNDQGVSRATWFRKRRARRLKRAAKADA